KSTTASRTSGSTQQPFRDPQVLFLRRCAPPSTRPGLHPSAESSFPVSRCAAAPASAPASDCPAGPMPHSGTAAPASGETYWEPTALPPRSSRPGLSRSGGGARASPSRPRSSVDVLSSTVSLHILLFGETSILLNRSLIFHLNRDKRNLGWSWDLRRKLVTNCLNWLRGVDLNHRPLGYEFNSWFWMDSAIAKNQSHRVSICWVVSIVPGSPVSNLLALLR